MTYSKILENYQRVVVAGYIAAADHQRLDRIVNRGTIYE